jgi:hypothetical protein
VRMKIDTVELGRKTWLRMRRMRPDEMLAAERVWIWDLENGGWRHPTLNLVDSF